MSDLVERMEIRLAGLEQWLKDNAPKIGEEQKHLDGGTAERAYWHYGYAAALRDVLAQLPRKTTVRQ